MLPSMASNDSGKAEVRRRQGEGFLWNPNAVVDDFRNASGYTDFTAAIVTAHRQERRYLRERAGDQLHVRVENLPYTTKSADAAGRDGFHGGIMMNIHLLLHKGKSSNHRFTKYQIVMQVF